MSDTSTEAQTRAPGDKKTEGWKSLLVYIAIMGAVYFGHGELQSFLGQRALEQLTLEQLSYDAALIRSSESGKPVLLNVSALWCPSCRKLDSKVLSDPDVQQAIEDNYVFSRVDYDTPEGELMRKLYPIRGVPTLLVLDSEGNALRRLPLTFNPDAFERSLLSPR